MKFLQVRLTLTLTLTLARVFWPRRDKAQALTLILPGGAAAEPQAGWARHSVTASGGRYEIVLGLRRTT